jgi:broad specificity phosphatase PhoE
MSKKIYLFRHGQIEERFQRRFVGSTDAKLSQQGKEQIIKFRSFIREHADGVFFYSPLSRAAESFRLATEGLSVTAHSDEDLREVDFGEWEGLSFEDIQERYAKPLHGWLKWDPDFAYPGGESHRSLLRRIKRCAARIKEAEAESVIVFTHGGIVRFLICELLGLAPEHYILFSAKRGTRTTLDVTDGMAVLEEINFKYE